MESVLNFFTDLHHLIQIRRTMSFEEMKIISDLYVHTFYYLFSEIDKINKMGEIKEHHESE